MLIRKIGPFRLILVCVYVMVVGLWVGIVAPVRIFPYVEVKRHSSHSIGSEWLHSRTAAHVNLLTAAERACTRPVQV